MFRWPSWGSRRPSAWSSTAATWGSCWTGSPPPARHTPPSAPRKEQRLVSPDVLKKMYVLRRILIPMGTIDAIEFLLDKLRQTKSNADFFDQMNQSVDC